VKPDLRKLLRRKRRAIAPKEIKYIRLEDTALVKYAAAIKNEKVDKFIYAK